MLEMTRALPARAAAPWPVPVALIGATHILLPAILVWAVPGALQLPGSWAGAALYAAELFALAYTSRTVARRMALANRVEAALAAVTIFLSVPAIVVTYLGFAGKLSLFSSLVVSGLAEMALLISIPDRETGGEFTAPVESEAQSPRASLLSVALGAVAALTFAVMVFNTIRYTPADSDTLWYHLPMVAQWIKTGSIAPIQSLAVMAQGYPGAREAILTWLALPMTSENLAFLVLLELPAILLSLYAICREFEVPAELAVALSALFLSTPEIAAWVATQKNDLFLALVFLLTLFFLIRWLKKFELRYAILAGISTGLLCAAKMSGPAYAATLAAVTFAVLLLRRKSESWPNIIRSLAATCAIAAAVAAPWYVRNYIAFRNPVYPKQVLFHGRVLFAGPFDAAYFAPITLGFDLPKLFANGKQFFDGLGVALPVLVAAPIFLLIVWAFFGRRPNSQFKTETVLWLAVLPALLLGVYMITPFSLLSRGVNSWEVQPRFLIPFAACLYVTLDVLLAPLKHARQIVLAIVGLACLWNLRFSTHYWWAIGALSLVLALGAAAARIDWTFSRRRVGSYAVSSALVIAFLTATVASHWMEGFRERRKDTPGYGYAGDISPGWGAVSLYVWHNISGKRILVLSRPEDFPLYGRGYTNELFAPDGTNGLDFVRKHRIDYIVGFRPFVRTGAAGEHWQYLPAVTQELLDRAPSKFQLVYVADGAQLVKVMP